MLFAMPAVEVVDDGVDAPAGSLFSWVVELPPGPEAMQLLCSIDPGSLDEFERVLLVRAWERQHAWLSARQQEALVAAVGVRPLTDDDWAVEEIAAAVRISSRAARNRVEAARVIVGSLPATREALEFGELSWRHAVAVVDEVALLDTEQIAEVESTVLAGAGERAVGDLRRKLRRAVAALRPDVALARHRRAVAERDVRFIPLEDGMAAVEATMAAVDARALFTAVDTLARARHAAEGGRRSGVRIGARRVDALAALAHAALADRKLPKAQGRRVELQVVIDAASLLGLADNPAQLDGYGPIPAAVARELAGDATWRRLVTDPVTGYLLDYGRTTYRPPKRLLDYLIARDRVCAMVGCDRPAVVCDADHRVPHGRGGRTSAENMLMLCRRHHRMKTHGRWRPRREPDGAITWISATGHEYRQKPRSQLDP
ncbi:MAG TPA: DUF222 domain-containing protein [Acidothermaceae bacterium]|nr:DUF222 domain-containing protein [Acidothermaceae bacterium]